jgi:hypothetical protein
MVMVVVVVVIHHHLWALQPMMNLGLCFAVS